MAAGRSCLGGSGPRPFGQLWAEVGSKSGGQIGSALGAVWERPGAERERVGCSRTSRNKRRTARPFRLSDRNSWTKGFDPAYCPARQGATNTLARGEPGRGRRVSTTPHSPHGRNNNQGRSQNEPRRFCVVWQRKALPIWSVQSRQTREILTHSGRPILGQFRDTWAVSA